MTSKAEIYCLVGISGSGKTTLAHKMAREMKTNAVIVSRDSLREMLFGYVPSTIGHYYRLGADDRNICERRVTDLQDQIVKAQLQGDVNVILDNTHLKLKYINQVKAYGVPVNFIKVDCALEDAVERDLCRSLSYGRTVGHEVIKQQEKDFKQLCTAFDFARYEPVPVEPIVQNDDLPGAYIFDIDGTLAINKGRSPFDWKRVGEDDENTNVACTAKVFNLFTDVEILIVSGRDEVCRPETEEWLSKYNIKCKKLYMRKAGDNRKDSIVKEEFWREIVKENYIIGMFDDRLQVINHARALGFTVFDVASNTF